MTTDTTPAQAGALDALARRCVQGRDYDGETWVRYSDYAELARASIAALARDPAPQDAYLRAADELLISAGELGTAEPSDTYEQARAKLDTLINWHVAVSADPRVNGGLSLQPAPQAPADAGEAVAWQARMTADGFTSQWADWPLDKERERKIGRWSVEYRALYTHPAPVHAAGEDDDVRWAINGLPALANNLHAEGQTSRADVIRRACRLIRRLAAAPPATPANAGEFVGFVNASDLPLEPGRRWKRVGLYAMDRLGQDGSPTDVTFLAAAPPPPASFGPLTHEGTKLESPDAQGVSASENSTPPPAGDALDDCCAWCLHQGVIHPNDGSCMSVRTGQPATPADAGVVGTLNVRAYRGMENYDFDYTGNLPDGTYSVYTTPQPPAPARVEVDDAMVERGARGHWEMIARGSGWDAATRRHETFKHVARAILTAALDPRADKAGGEAGSNG